MFRLVGILIITAYLNIYLNFSQYNTSNFPELFTINSAFAGSEIQKISKRKSPPVKTTLFSRSRGDEYENIGTLSFDIESQNSGDLQIKLSAEVGNKRKKGPILIPPEVRDTWRKNAVQLGKLPPGPRIAIVIDDAGLDKKRTAEVINLTGPLTISFLAYGRGLPEQVKLAKNAGHEILVHIAMEPLNKSIDPGPKALLTNNPGSEILKNLRWGLERFEGYVGINNHMGSRFTSDPQGMEIVIQELKRRGLLFLDSRTSDMTVSASIALAHDVPFAERNIFLDNVNSVSAIKKQLRLMEKFANKYGSVVAIAHPRDNTIKVLSQWLAIMAEKGFVQVPISTIIAEKRSLSAIKSNNKKF